MKETYTQYALKTLETLINIPSPSGYTDHAAEYIMNELAALGYQPKMTNKGGVTVKLDGEGDDGLLLACHIDTLGGMVASIDGNGKLKIAPLGFLSANNIESVNVTVHTRSGKVYEGTCQMDMPSWHINSNYDTTARSFDVMQIVLDEDVSSEEDVRALGIDTGDIICFDPNFRVTEKGYIKSRHLDNKLSACILLTLAKALKEENIVLSRNTYMHFSVYEEVGHGASGYCPAGVSEFLAVDMACVGPQFKATERMVAICAKDIEGPSSYRMVSALSAVAKKLGIDCPIEVYANYASDADVAVRAAGDVRHCTVGAGVFASHGYERSHIDGLKNAFDLVKGYILR